MGWVHKLRHWDDLDEAMDNEFWNRLIRPTNTWSLVLEAPDIQVFSTVITQAIGIALEKLLLSYSEPELTTDDRWYYGVLKELLYTDEGNVNRFAFQTSQEYVEFFNDPVGGFYSYYDQTSSLFEEIVEINRGNIGVLYDAVNIHEITATIGCNIITLSIRGTSA